MTSVPFRDEKPALARLVYSQHGSESDSRVVPPQGTRASRGSRRRGVGSRDVSPGGTTKHPESASFAETTEGPVPPRRRKPARRGGLDAFRPATND